jgi:hypothetical protein
MILSACLGLSVTSMDVQARLVTPIDVVVEWKDPGGKAAGYIVEYVNQPTDEWVILGFFPPATRRYHHPRLAPNTPYQYRVRPFFGPASPPIEVTVARRLSDQAYARAYALPEDYSWALPRKIAPAASARHQTSSIKDPATEASAAPDQLAAQIIASTVSGFRLTWRDRSNDEEGFLLERVVDATTFVVCAAVEPDVSSFGWALEPPTRKGTFRVRAYHFGPSSATVAVTTGSDPPGASAPSQLPPGPRNRATARRSDHGR